MVLFDAEARTFLRLQCLVRFIDWHIYLLLMGFVSTKS